MTIRESLDAVAKDKPQSFTVGATFVDGKLVGGVTYQRTWKNGWGATAFARAWWDDTSVTPGVAVEAGVEVVKKF